MDVEVVFYNLQQSKTFLLLKYIIEQKIPMGTFFLISEIYKELDFNKTCSIQVSWLWKENHLR